MAANQPSSSPIHIGICGGGLGGLTTAIALRRAGVQVTVLEQAAELGDIGAGIQMTPNVSRLLIKWGVADLILKDLVEVEELNVRRCDGTVSEISSNRDFKRVKVGKCLTGAESRIY
jgi:2-polyprenyl-6-methoxyphenol hydroxylase-like FAD-dependent oxidoreductase